MAEFGAGPLLTQDLDFEVDETGDLRSTFGTDELQKDIAMQSLIQLQDVIGSRYTNRTRARITTIVQRILNDDPRVDIIRNIDVRLLDGENTAEVIAEIDGSDDTQELVFEV